MLAKSMSWLYWVKSYYRKTIFAKKRLFLEFLLSGGQTVDLRSNLRTRWRKNVKRAIECAFLQCCISSGYGVMCQFVEKCWNRQNLTFGDLWWPDLWPDLKNDWSSFFMIFDALSNAVYRVSLHGPWAELDGGCSNTPLPARAVRRRAAARRGLRKLFTFGKYVFFN